MAWYSAGSQESSRNPKDVLSENKHLYRLQITESSADTSFPVSLCGDFSCCRLHLFTSSVTLEPADSTAAYSGWYSPNERGFFRLTHGCNMYSTVLLTPHCAQVSCGAATVTPSQAARAVDELSATQSRRAVPLTLQSAVKHYYPPVILLIPRKHPAVTRATLSRTWHRMRYHSAVGVSPTDDGIPVNTHVIAIGQLGFYFDYLWVGFFFYVLACWLHLQIILDTADLLFSRIS